MTEKEELVPRGTPWREGDDQPVVEPEIVDAEVVDAEVVEKKGQGSRRPVTWQSEFQQGFGVPPFPLSANKLAYLVRRVDWEGPQFMGPFYQARLHEECALLLPQPVYGFDDWRFFEMLATWHRNSMFFKCRAIGDLLACLELARQNYETMR